MPILEEKPTALEREVGDSASRDGASPQDGPHAEGSKRRLLYLAMIVGAAVALVGLAIFLLVPKGESGVALPKDFPTQQQLPVAEGERVSASDPSGPQMSLTVKVPSHAAQQAALKDLEQAGYSVVGSQGSGPVGAVTSLSTSKFAVRVEFDHSKNNGYTVTYLTSPVLDQGGAK